MLVVALEPLSMLASITKFRKNSELLVFSESVTYHCTLHACHSNTNRRTLLKMTSFDVLMGELNYYIGEAVVINVSYNIM